MALTPGVLDVSLSTTNQVTSDTMGPLGQLRNMVNAQVQKYEPHFQGAQGVVPAKIQVRPRDAFNSLPSAARSVVDGTAFSPSWTNQRLLAELDSQLVSICGGSIPRVFNGNTWSTYVNNAVLTQELSQEVLHTSGHTIQCPDAAWLGGVTCCVWTETTINATGPLTTSYVGFKADNGAWLVQPAALYAANSPLVVAQAKVVQDGTYFWVFFSTFTSVSINVYDTNGALLAAAATTIPLPLHNAFSPGNWDVVATTTTGGYTVLAAVIADQTSDAGVNLYALKYVAPASIAANAVAITSPTIHARDGIAFLTNDFVAGSAYLASQIGGTPAAIYAYEITNQAVTHSYASGVTDSTVSAFDSITGYVTSAGFRTLIISYTTLATGAASGPKLDPQRRAIKSFAYTPFGVVTQLRTTQSLCQVSRAFAVDGNYYVFGYYQSGAGLAWEPTKVTTVGQVGDYMIGAAVQDIPVQAGDAVVGSPIKVSSNHAIGSTVYVSDASGAASIASGDTVSFLTASGISTYGIPNGSVLLRWKFNALGPTVLSVGGRLRISGSSGVSSADGDWDIVYQDGTYFYTSPQAADGHILPAGGTLSAAGTVQRIAMAGYEVSDLSPYINVDTAGPFVGGTFTVTGAATSGNNGTFTVARVWYGVGPNFGYNSVSVPIGVVWVQRTTQVVAVDTFSGTLTPQNSNRWSFALGEFDFTYVGTNLVVAGDSQVTANVGTYPITAVTNPTQVVTGGATSIISQIFDVPLPQISVQLTTQVPYTFFFAGLTPDYTYVGGILAIQGATTAANNGTYKIIQVNADGSFVALPTNGLSNQVNEGFGPSQTVTVYINPNPAPEFQPTWFIVPITGSQPVAGRFEYGLAYADWRREGDATYPANIFRMGLSTPVATSSGTMIVLPYRAENVTAAVTQITAAGAVDIGEASFESTVGLKQFWIGTRSGHAYANSGELLIPGPMASVYTSSGFFEDNVNVAPEQPFLVSQSVGAAGTLGLTLNSQRIYVVVFEQTDENGNRIYSQPSPALVVNMSGTNNVATIGGRLPFPLGTDGKPVANTYGPTCRNVTISIYATAFVNGVPTTNRYKITSDLYANGLAPTSTANPSGFSFPDSFTWNYVDQNPDSQVQDGEILYTDKGYLPRFPAPAFSAGVASWHNREWVLGYDGAIWMSGEKTEGDAIWFNPAFRFVLPTDDEPLGLAAMEDYLIVCCANSIWYIPSAQFPDATGGNGTLPTPVRLPFQNGSIRGLAQTIREGVAYDSTAGGLWLITRNLDNIWLSHPVVDSLATPIIDLALDKQQRLFVLQQSGPIMVYDGVPAAWYAWQAPTAGVLLSTYGGQAVYQDAANVNAVAPAQAADVVGGVTYGIAPDITLAPLSIGNVRGLKRVWEFQIVGTYLGPHRLNVVLSYPEDDWPATVYQPFTPDGTSPYVIPINPLFEEASQYTIRVYADFVGVGSPGLTFAMEMISAQVGLDSSVGLNKRPTAKTALAGT